MESIQPSELIVFMPRSSRIYAIDVVTAFAAASSLLAVLSGCDRQPAKPQAAGPAVAVGAGAGDKAEGKPRPSRLGRRRVHRRQETVRGLEDVLRLPHQVL